MGVRHSEDILGDLADRVWAVFYRMSLPDGRYEYISPGCIELTGYTPDEFYASPFLVRELVRDDFHPYFEQAWRRLLDGDMPPMYEYPIIDRAGRTRWLRQLNVLVRDQLGRPTAIEGVVSEVTGYKRAQAELRQAIGESERKLQAANDRLRQEIAAHQQALTELRDRGTQYRLVTDNVPAAIAYVDKDERYRFNNRTYEDWFGQSPAEIYGRSVREVVGDDAYLHIEARLRAALAGEPATFEASLPYRYGGARWVRASYVPDRDAEQRVRGVFVLVSDITDLKRAETGERRHLLELSHAARLSSLGEMASQLMHELGQPLAAIVNYTTVAPRLLEQGDTDAIKAVCEQLGEHAKRAQNIMAGTRRFMRKEGAARESIDVLDLVRNSLDLVRWEAEARGVSLRLEAPRSLPQVSADRTLIEQVIVNLVRNALDALGPYPGPDRPVIVALRATPAAVEISVSDLGPGLTPEAKARLFEPFFTTKPDGVGIGLVICRRIVEAHSGRLWAEDNPCGQGARFGFTLPTSPDADDTVACGSTSLAS